MMAASVSLAELASARIPLHPSEAAAIVAEVCRQYDRGELRGIPSAHVVRLTADGRVVAQGPTPTDQPPVRRAAQLLEELIPSFDGSARGPGGLRLVMARALGTIDLPAFESVVAFCRALDRFAVADLPGTAGNLYRTWEFSRAPRSLTISDLRRARRATGLSLEDISAASGIDVERLRELEWGYFRNWNADDRGRDELRRYARAAGLDDGVVVEVAWPLIDEAPPATPATPAAGASGASGARMAAAAGAEAVQALVRSGPQGLTAIPAPVVVESRRWRRSSVATACAAVAALLILASTVFGLRSQPPIVREARVDPPTVGLAASDEGGVGSAHSIERVDDARVFPPSPLARSAKAQPRRPAAVRKAPRKPSFFKRQWFRIVIR